MSSIDPALLKRFPELANRRRPKRPPNLLTDRLDLIDGEIRSGSHPSRKRLALTCMTTVRTIQRDLDYMIARGAPVEYSKALRGYYYTHKNWNPLGLRVVGPDFFALALARKAMLALRADGSARALEKLYYKFLVRLPAHLRMNPDIMTEGFIITTPQREAWPGISERVWDTLVQAVRRRQVVQATLLKSANETRNRALLELHYLTICDELGWMVQARSRKTGEESIIPVAEIDSLKPIEEYFVRLPKQR